VVALEHGTIQKIRPWNFSTEVYRASHPAQPLIGDELLNLLKVLILRIIEAMAHFNSYPRATRCNGNTSSVERTVVTQMGPLQHDCIVRSQISEPQRRHDQAGQRRTKQCCSAQLALHKLTLCINV
jgi:hypothetical protein